MFHVAPSHVINSLRPFDSFCISSLPIKPFALREGLKEAILRNEMVANKPGCVGGDAREKVDGLGR